MSEFISSTPLHYGPMTAIHDLRIGLADLENRFEELEGLVGKQLQHKKKHTFTNAEGQAVNDLHIDVDQPVEITDLGDWTEGEVHKSKSKTTVKLKGDALGNNQSREVELQSKKTHTILRYQWTLNGAGVGAPHTP